MCVCVFLAPIFTQTDTLNILCFILVEFVFFCLIALTKLLVLVTEIDANNTRRGMSDRHMFALVSFFDGVTIFEGYSIINSTL